jgi:hypothetical protein
MVQSVPANASSGGRAQAASALMCWPGRTALVFGGINKQRAARTGVIARAPGSARPRNWLGGSPILGLPALKYTCAQGVSLRREGEHHASSAVKRRTTGGLN